MPVIPVLEKRHLAGEVGELLAIDDPEALFDDDFEDESQEKTEEPKEEESSSEAEKPSLSEKLFGKRKKESDNDD